MWVTNGLGSGVVFVLMKNDPKADPPYEGMTCFITEKEPWAEKNAGDFAGLEIPPKIKKMGYKGVESTELVYDGYKCPPERILGGEEDGLGQGFAQMMDALEVGRVNVAARGVGIAQRALELALRYSQERKTFGKPIAQHQAIQFKLADMATKVEAARLVTMKAARLKDAGERSDLEAGMAKLLASETGKEVVEDALPHPRRLRLLEGVRDRAPLPRRAAAADRRGHLRDPAHGDRQQAARAQQDLSGRASRSPWSAAPAAGSGARSPASWPPTTASRCWPAPAIPPPRARGGEPDHEGGRSSAVEARRRRPGELSTGSPSGSRADPGRLDVAGQQRRRLRLSRRARRLRPRRGPRSAGDERLRRLAADPGAAAAAARSSAHGRIVNVSSGGGQLTDMKGGRAAYRISKTGLNALTRVLAADEAGGGSSSTRSARAGCAPTWAARARRARSRRAPTPPSGWRRFPTTGRAAASSATASRSPGSAAARRWAASGGAAERAAGIGPSRRAA